MISMTGYGAAERQDDRYSTLVEVKSYNNRYLDVNCSLPGALSSLEPRIRESVARVARRGRVEVFLRFRDKDENLAVSLDRGVVRGYLEAIRELREPKVNIWLL